MIKSDDYYYRKRIAKTLEVPTISQIKESLKEPLADLFFESCSEQLKPIIGLAPPLEGPGNTLWVSPSDLLTGIVKLKPPLTCKHIAALTHQGILEIGKVIEDKFIKQWEAEKKMELDEQEEILLFRSAREKQLAIELTIEKQEKQCARTIQTIIHDYEQKILRVIKTIQKKCNEHCDEMLHKQKCELDEEWTERVYRTVEQTIQDLSRKCVEEMKLQEEQLEEHCQNELLKEQEKGNLAINEERAKFQQLFRQLRHQLECRNMANLMYILSMERRKCKREKDAMEWEFKQKIIELENICNTNLSKVEHLQEETKKQRRQIDMREECLLEIIKQFQKFINFALRAVPTQAEFLLNVEQLTLFEFKQAMMETDKKRASRIALGIRKWNAAGDAADVDNAKQTCESLRLNDFHACNEEVELPEDNRSMGDNDDLPAFRLNESLYVREDFRNMVSQGIEVSRNSMLWCADVERLVSKLKSNGNVEPSLNDQSRNPSVRFPSLHVENAQSVPQKNSSDMGSRNLKSVLVKSSGSVEKAIHIGELAPKLNILASKDSVEDIKAAKAVCDNESVCMVNTEEPFLHSTLPDKVADVLSKSAINRSRQLSKLSLARDSLEIIRRSRANSLKMATIEETGGKTSNRSSQQSITKAPKIRTSVQLETKQSRLSMTRNSFELISRSIQSIATSEKTRKPSREVELFNSELVESKKPEGEIASVKSVHLSYIEVVHIPEKTIPRMQKNVKSPPKNRLHHHIPWKIYQSKSLSGSSNAFSQSQISVPISTPKQKMGREKGEATALPEVRIAGERKGKEHLQEQNDFALCRINSMLQLLKKSPSLRRIFTSTTK